MRHLFWLLLSSAAATARDRPRVVAYHVLATGRATWSRIDFSRLTTIVQFGPGWDPDLAATARAASVEVLSEWGWACLPSQPCDWLGNRTAAAGKAAAAVALVAAREADGLNVDIEGAGEPHCTAADLTAFVAALRAGLDGHRKGMTLLVNVNAFPAAVSPQAGQAYNFTALAGPATGVAIMMYDMDWWNPGVPRVAAPNSPLDKVARTLGALVDTASPQHVPAGRLLPIFPWYGYDFLCNSTVRLSPCRNTLPFCCGPGTAAAQVSYAAVMTLLGLKSATAVQRGQPGQERWRHRADGRSDSRLSPWFEYTDASKRRHQVHFDDLSSLPAKYEVAASLGLGGFGIWTANADYLVPLSANHTVEQAALFSTLNQTA